MKIIRNISLIIVFLCLFFVASNFVYAENDNNNNNNNNNSYVYVESDWELCTNQNVVKTFKFAGNILRVAFIIIPILLIVLGSIDFLKATAASKEDDIKKAQQAFIKRTIAAVIVFLVPLITSIVLNVLDAPSETKSHCLTCLLNPDNC